MATTPVPFWTMEALPAGVAITAAAGQKIGQHCQFPADLPIAGGRTEGTIPGLG